MKNINRIFRDAERLRPSEELWARIESEALINGMVPSADSRAVPKSESKTSRGGSSAFASFTPSFTPYRLAASAVLAAGLLTAGLFLQNRSEPGKTAHAGASANATAAQPQPAVDIVDPELLAWAADLGELNTDADESAEEVL